MSKQINNAVVSQSSTSTYSSMNYVYKSSKSVTGFVITSKQLKGVEPSWCSDSLISCQAWIAKHGTNPMKGVDTQEEKSYDVKHVEEMNVMNIESMNLQELVALQLQVAQRISQLVAVLSDNVTTIQNEELSAEQAGTIEPSPEEIVPSNAVESEEAPRKKVSIRIGKKDSNVEAVAAKIEKDVCTFTRDEAKAFIKENKLPINGKLKVNALCDAINAFNQGGLEAVPTEYLTTKGIKMVEQSKKESQRVEAAHSPKKPSSKKLKSSAAK